MSRRPLPRSAPPDSPSPRGRHHDKAAEARSRARARILEHLRAQPGGAKTRGLYNQLGRPLPYAEFTGLLDEMERQGELRKGDLRRWQAAGGGATVKGVLLRLPSGHGFLQPDDAGERVFLHRSQLDRYLQEDWLEARLLPGKGPSREGRVVRLLERRLTHIVGRASRYGMDWLLQPESVRFGGLVRLRGKVPRDLAPGERLRVALLPDPDGTELPGTLYVEVEERLDGASGAAWHQERIKAEFNLPGAFSPAQEAEARRVRQEELVPREGRLDLRGECIFTIDPADAKDFDDAVSVQALPDGGWRLGVHIADVSWFVAEDGALDREALRRGLSIYLPGEVVPMLPHALSSGLCSLQEGVDRYCMSVHMVVGPRGAVRGVEVAPSLIRSVRRFSYDDVQEILAGLPLEALPAGEVERRWPDPITLSLYHMNRLWRLLKRLRLSRGGLDFALPEPVFTLDGEGNPLAVGSRVSRDANFLIEEFMLLANRCVAERLVAARRACLFRIHDAPEGEKLERFRSVLEHLGERPVPELARVADWQAVLARWAERPEAPFLQQMMLRSMMKAQYSPHNVGHFGLGFEHYAHFTSPIRRYPDLVVHRLLKRLDEGSGDPGAAALATSGRRSTQRELLALEAERAAVKVKQILYLQRHLGEEFWGLVRGVERFGVFVELESSLAEGLVPLAELPEDFWDYREASWELRARRLGRSIRLGDRVLVQVLRANPESRDVDFRLVEFGDGRRRELPVAPPVALPGPGAKRGKGGKKRG
jgi:ribonuclease R